MVVKVQNMFMFQITLTTTWKEVKKVIKEDPRCIKFSSSDRVRQLKSYLDGFVGVK